jgi:2-oxoglutarate dehydrogenase E2 component (dihydrolipoamide succinyltransferase)
LKEFLVNEEDTVTVGQDLVRMELGGSSSGGDKTQADAEPKEPASKEQPTSSDPEPTNKESSKANDQDTPAPPPPKQEKQPEKQPEKQAEKKSDKKLESSQSQNTASAPTLGSREERRVSRQSEPLYSLLTTRRSR